jgi:hypothetical protein
LKEEISFSPKITLLKRMDIQVWIMQSSRKAWDLLRGGTYLTIREQMSSIARLLKHGVYKLLISVWTIRELKELKKCLDNLIKW